jgi:DNA (cytosine-5)-methyltransferase 1
MSDFEVVHLFAGPGGWEEGMRRVAPRTGTGFELDKNACATAVAAGHARVQADVSRIATALVVRIMRGLVASPPCTKFSPAGKGLGRIVMDLLAEGIRRMFQGVDCREQLADDIYPTALAEQEAANAKRPDGKKWPRERVEKAARADADSTVLVLEPARFIADALAAGGPLEWVALEQVESVLPLWKVYAQCLRELGWSVWAGALNAADFGVPQVRERAVLMARRHGDVAPPAPTHARTPGPVLFGEELAPWVTMADALGWGMTARPSMTVTSGGATTGGAEPFGNAARQGMRRELEDGRWAWRRSPAVVAGDPPIAAPGDGDRAGGDCQDEESIRITIREAAILQSFPADYPWQGTQGSQFLQCGNAVPPGLAAAVVTAVVPSDVAVAA